MIQKEMEKENGVELDNYRMYVVLTRIYSACGYLAFVNGGPPSGLLGGLNPQHDWANNWATLSLYNLRMQSLPCMKRAEMHAMPCVDRVHTTCHPDCTACLSISLHASTETYDTREGFSNLWPCSNVDLFFGRCLELTFCNSGNYHSSRLCATSHGNLSPQPRTFTTLAAAVQRAIPVIPHALRNPDME